MNLSITYSKTCIVVMNVVSGEYDLNAFWSRHLIWNTYEQIRRPQQKENSNNTNTNQHQPHLCSLGESGRKKDKRQRMCVWVVYVIKYLFSFVFHVWGFQAPRVRVSGVCACVYGSVLLRFFMCTCKFYAGAFKCLWVRLSSYKYVRFNSIQLISCRNNVHGDHTYTQTTLMYECRSVLARCINACVLVCVHLLNNKIFQMTENVTI